MSEPKKRIRWDLAALATEVVLLPIMLIAGSFWLGKTYGWSPYVEITGGLVALTMAAVLLKILNQKISQD
ncbi:MAG: hypothetical protein KDD52_03270 [Bdellovibrionales bacterium]|nr:hypothetical protein [Bdellovibrionales bacterium]